MAQYVRIKIGPTFSEIAMRVFFFSVAFAFAAKIAMFALAIYLGWKVFKCLFRLIDKPAAP